MISQLHAEKEEKDYKKEHTQNRNRCTSERDNTEHDKGKNRAMESQDPKRKKGSALRQRMMSLLGSSLLRRNASGT